MSEDATADEADATVDDEEMMDGGAPGAAETATDGEEYAADGDDGSTTGLADADVWRYLRLGAIGLLSLLALIATVQLYTNTSAAIAEWVSPTYVPVFQAAFNLVVLLLALAGLAVLARRRFVGG